MSLVGTQLGHYRLLRFINGGGMGEVYLAEDLTLSRQVAIKIMKTEGSLYPNAQESQEVERLFQREMKVIAALDHPNILTLLEAGEQTIDRERITFMVMPFCPEGSLADWIKQYHGDKLLTPQEVSQLLTYAAEALQHAHDQHILHLDIKPQNFLVRRSSDPKALPNLLLADFGVAKIASSTKMSGTPRGTFAYMAPEQLANQPGPASDQYALGIMTYELLTGHTPFEGALPQVIFYQHAQVMPDPPSKIRPSLPKSLDAVVLRALAKKPEDRYPSVRAFAQAFAAALNQPKKPAASVPPPPPVVSTYPAPPPAYTPPIYSPPPVQPQPVYSVPPIQPQPVYPPPPVPLVYPPVQPVYSGPLYPASGPRQQLQPNAVRPGQRQAERMMRRARRRRFRWWLAIGIGLLIGVLYEMVAPHAASESVGWVVIISFVVALFVFR